MISENWLVSFCFLDLSIPLGICLKHLLKRAVILLDFLFGNPWAMRSFWLRQRCLSWHIFCGIRYASCKRYFQLLISDLTHLEVNFPPKKKSGHRFWEMFLNLYICLVCSGVSSQWLERISDWDPFYPPFSLGEFDTARGEWHFIFPILNLIFPMGPLCVISKSL